MNPRYGLTKGGITGIIAAFMLLIAGAPCTEAQPVLNFKRIINNWPTIELYFTVSCDGAPAYFSDKRFFRVFENDVEIRDFDLWCPDPRYYCAISVSLVLDASGSMEGAGMAGAKNAGLAFIDLMDGMADEACVISSSSSAIVVQSMTYIKESLRNAIDDLRIEGETAIWDGILEGVGELVNEGINPCRAVIVISDGEDNASSRTPEEIIAYAARNRIRIFTIGLGPDLRSGSLKYIADMTGGRYYETPSDAQIAAILREINDLGISDYQECLITYMAYWTDGSTRKVDLSIVDFCDGSDTRTKTYKAPLDSSSMMLMKPLGSHVSRSGRELSIPVSTMTPPTELKLAAPEFILQWDSTYARFAGIGIPPSGPLHGKTIIQESSTEGLKITIPDTVKVSNAGELFSLVFNTPGPPLDTAETELKLLCRLNARGLPSTETTKGHLRVLPESPRLAAIAQAGMKLRWNRDSIAYEPRPFPVVLRITNSGELPAHPLTQRIEYDARVFSLHPESQDSVLSMTTPLAPGDTMIVTWMLQARNVQGVLSSTIATAAEFSDHGVVRSSLIVQLPIPGVRAEILKVVEQGERTQRARFRVHCDGERISAFQEGSISAAVYGRPAKVLSVDCPAGSDYCELIFEEPCPDGRQHLLDLFFAALCDSSATATLTYIAQTLLTRIDVFGPAHLCAGDTALLMAAEGMSSYHWSTGDTTRSIRVSSPGVYSVATVDSNGCSLSSETVIITTARKPVIKPNGHVTVCAGDSVTLDGGAEYASYLWSNGAVTRRITVACEGVYTVNVTGYDGCAATADSVRTVAAPRPPKPVITRSVDELSTQTADSCQWLLDGVEITGATQRTITASGTGVYRVRVKNEYGCTAESDDYPVTVLDAGAAAHDPLVELVLYPDPVSDALVISRSGAGRAVEIAIFDMLGRLRFAGGIPEGTARITVETAAWTPGPYLLHARSGENITVRMFMKRGAVGGFR